MLQYSTGSIRTKIWNGAQLRGNAGSCGVGPVSRSLMVVARWRSGLDSSNKQISKSE